MVVWFHSDLCGPMLEMSGGGGANYKLLFADDFSRETFAYFTHSESQVDDKFVEFKALAVRQANKNLKTLRSGSGKEFTNSKLRQLLKKN